MTSNVKTIDEFVLSLRSISILNANKKVYKEIRTEILEKGYYTNRINLTYTLDEIEYAISLINLRIRLLKAQEK